MVMKLIGIFSKSFEVMNMDSEENGDSDHLGSSSEHAESSEYADKSEQTTGNEVENTLRVPDHVSQSTKANTHTDMHSSAVVAKSSSDPETVAPVTEVEMDTISTQEMTTRRSCTN